MVIIFIRDGKTPKQYRKQNRIELKPDVPWDHSRYKPWDDHGYKTAFSAVLYFKEKEYELPLIKILLENQTDTHKYLKGYLEELGSRSFEFPIENIKYVSLPTDTEFYQVLKSLLTKNEVEQVIEELYDASYIKHTDAHKENKFLLETEGFNSSLLRDMTARSSFENGWLMLEERTISKNEMFKLQFQLDSFSNQHKIDINFKKSIFPSNINILIGANGTGKSQTLNVFMRQLLGIDPPNTSSKLPVFNKIVLIAYSPFENYLTSLNEQKIRVKSQYKYFGFRTEQDTYKKEQPAIDTVEGLFKIIEEDDEKDFLENRINKLDALMKILKKAIVFDNIGLKLDGDSSSIFQANNEIVDDVYIINDAAEFLLVSESLKKVVDSEKGIVFTKNDMKIHLSSGQQIFSHLITCAVSAIRQDTMLLIDEPEIYLHPNLEVELMNLLKEMLEEFNSYAIIATHSLILTREVSKDYTVIFKQKEENINCMNPPFETFGGDIEKINSYVFFDKDIDKPYESWLQDLVDLENGSKNAIKKYMNELNEESLILMNGMSVRNAK